MEQQPLKTPSPNAGSSPKRVLEDQSDSNPPKRLKSTSGGGNDGSSNDDYVPPDNDKSIITSTQNSSSDPHRLSTTSTTSEIRPSIEVSPHRPNNEGIVPLHSGMSGNTITIRDPSRTTPSPRSQPTTTPERNIFTNPAQTSEESSAEDDIDESPLPSSASIPSPSPSPAPAPAPVPSPSPSVLLAELPYGLLSPTPVSSVTASPTPPASRWVNFSPSPRAGSRSPFSSYTSISEGGSDDEGWPDDEEWLNAAAVLENADDDDEEWLDLMWQLMEEEDDELGDFFLWEIPQIPDDWIVPVPSLVVQEVEEPVDVWEVPQNDWLVPSLVAQEVEAALVDDFADDYDGDDDDDSDEDNDSDEEDDGTENSNSDDNESTGGQTLFCSRYDSWPDFDDDSPGGQTTNYISDDEDGSEWDIKSDALHEGPRYPGMNAFRLEGYTPAHDQPLDSGDQELEGIYITDDEDEESDADDEDEDEWAIENESELEAQPWGAGMRIIHYHPSMWM